MWNFPCKNGNWEIYIRTISPFRHIFPYLNFHEIKCNPCHQDSFDWAFATSRLCNLVDSELPVLAFKRVTGRELLQFSEAEFCELLDDHSGGFMFRRFTEMVSERQMGGKSGENAGKIDHNYGINDNIYTFFDIDPKGRAAACFSKKLRWSFLIAPI